MKAARIFFRIRFDEVPRFIFIYVHLDMLCTHCAPLERGCWTYHDSSIDISLLWSEKQKSSGLIIDPPQKHRLVPTPTRKQLPIRAERHTIDRLRMPGERPLRFTCRRIP